MEKIYELKEKLCEELDKVSEEMVRKPGLNAGDLEFAHMLSDTIKNIDKIDRLEDDGYSRDGGGYGRGMSYARGRGGRNVRRDNRGRYSRDDGRSEMLEHLEMALDSASEQDRESIRRFMRQMDNA